MCNVQFYLHAIAKWLARLYPLIISTKPTTNDPSFQRRLTRSDFHRVRISDILDKHDLQPSITSWDTMLDVAIFLHVREISEVKDVRGQVGENAEAWAQIK
jgi:hypothetical protein